MSGVSKGIENNLNQYIKLDLRSLFVMSEVLKVLYTHKRIEKLTILQHRC